jgi:general nucleoside transport system permease protein
MIGVVSMSIARILSDNDDLTSSGTFGVALRTAAPIALAGLAGLFAERSGTVNIGLEGMMIMGTIFAGWWGWEYGPWMAIVGGIVGGMLAGLLMSLATTTFGVNHIVAGFAINILAPGVARFMANELFTGARAARSPRRRATREHGPFTMPFTSGGDLFGWQTPTSSGGSSTGLVHRRRPRRVRSRPDHQRVVRRAAHDGVFVLAGYVLWRTPFGLRLRAAGERRQPPTRSACRSSRCATTAWPSRAASPAWAAPCSCCSPTATRRTRWPVAASSASPR